MQNDNIIMISNSIHFKVFDLPTAAAALTVQKSRTCKN